jgi:hypothetical protein
LSNGSFCIALPPIIVPLRVNGGPSLFNPVCVTAYDSRIHRRNPAKLEKKLDPTKYTLTRETHWTIMRVKRVNRHETK